jgi:hypothetical protein
MLMPGLPVETVEKAVQEADPETELCASRVSPATPCVEQLPAGEEADKMSDSGQLFRPFRAGGVSFPTDGHIVYAPLDAKGT